MTGEPIQPGANVQSHDRKELRRLDAVMGLRFDTDQHEIFLRLRGWPMGGGVVCGPHMPWAPPWRGLPHDREMMQLLLQQSISTLRPGDISTVHAHPYHHTTRHAWVFNDIVDCNNYFPFNAVTESLHT